MNEKQSMFVYMLICECVWMVILTHIAEDLQNPGLGNKVAELKKIQLRRQAQIIES